MTPTREEIADNIDQIRSESMPKEFIFKIIDYILTLITEAKQEGYKEACSDNPQRSGYIKLIVSEAERQARVEAAGRVIECANMFMENHRGNVMKRECEQIIFENQPQEKAQK